MSVTQDTLPGFAPDVQPVDLTRRNAFARVPFAEYWGVDESKFNGITSVDEALVEPDVIRARLYPETRGKKHAIDGIVFTPSEYAVVPLNIRTFAGRVGARALGANNPFSGEKEGEVGVDKRAAAHTFEAHIPRLENLVSGYVGAIATMRWLKKEIPYHWLAHATEATMRQRTASARYQFSEVIDSVAASDEWSEDKLVAARLAHEKKLLTGKLDDKKAYWLGFTAVTGNLAIGKKALVSNRIQQMNNYIQRAQPVVE